jgi:hypothetical protein
LKGQASQNVSIECEGKIVVRDCIGEGNEALSGSFYISSAAGYKQMAQRVDVRFGYAGFALEMLNTTGE